MLFTCSRPHRQEMAGPGLELGSLILESVRAHVAERVEATLETAASGARVHLGRQTSAEMG